MDDSSSDHEGSLLWTLEEISRLVSYSGDPSETLANIVRLIQQRFATDVCSVYLLEPARARWSCRRRSASRAKACWRKPFSLETLLITASKILGNHPAA